VTVCFKLAQDGTGRGSSDIGHICQIFVVQIDFDRTVVWRVDVATAIPGAK
jgi:hypothetical protein